MVEAPWANAHEWQTGFLVATSRQMLLPSEVFADSNVLTMCAVLAVPIVFLLAFSGFASVAAWNLVGEPNHARVTETGDKTFICQADVALDRCQFKIHRRFSGQDYGDGLLIKFDLGARSKPETPTAWNGYDYQAAYAGTGLDAGQCGILLTRIYYGWFTIGCRARALDGTWNQTEMTVFSGHEQPIGMEVEPSAVMVEVGGEVSTLCEAEKPLAVCRYFSPFLPDGTTQFTSRPAPNDRFEYYGSGLEDGECGLTFHNVTEELNGIVWCNGITPIETRDGRATFITVIRHPSPPVIEFSSSSLHSGEVFSANCNTTSRPAAQVSWFLDDKPLNAEVSSEDPDWRWPWDLANVTSRVSWKLRADDDGKKLKCVVTDVTTGETLRVEKALTVKDASDWELTVTPEHVHAKDGNTTVLCKAPVPLTECHFRVANDKDKNSGQRIIDFNNGYLSSPITERLRSGEIIYIAEYNGSGLENGECGARIASLNWGRFVVGCRARAALGQFRYGEMTIFGTAYEPVGQKVVAPVVTAVAGGNATVGCNAPGPVSKCRFFLPSGSSVSYKKSRPSSGRFHTGATDLERGECRLTITAVSARDVGHVWCVADTKAGGEDGRLVTLVIPKAPSPPTLRLDTQALRVGAKIRATCEVLGGIPASRLSWKLGDVALGGTNLEAKPDSSWKWLYEPRDSVQIQTRTLTAADDGKALVCTARHEALAAPMQASHVIRFNKGGTGTPSAPSGTKTCPPLSSTTVSFQCNLNGLPVDCTGSDRVPIGARAQMGCKAGFRLDTFPGSRLLTCLSNGRWNRKPWSCTPDCGRRNDNSAQTVVAGGTEAKFAEFPWHAAIFYKGPRSKNEHLLVCGGSLISPKFIVSAAHCFWDFISNARMNESDYNVVTGRSGLYWNEEEGDEQRRSVRKLHIHERYNGVKLSHAADIVLIEVTAPFEMGWATNLVCIDWTNEFEHAQLAPGTNGTIPGWGLDKSDKQSVTLNYVMLPFVPYDECRATVSVEYLSFLTPDKICAGFKGKGTSVCQGDSGGGYVFPTPRAAGVRYYLRGIVSNVMRERGQAQRRCNTEQVSVHTRISEYLDWMSAIITAASLEPNDYD